MQHTKKLTNGQLRAAYQALASVYAQRLPISVMQRVKKGVVALEEEVKLIEELRQRILDEQDYRPENQSPSQAVLLEEQLEELAEQETEVDLPSLDLGELGEVEVSGPELTILQHVFEKKEDDPGDHRSSEKVSTAEISTGVD